MLNILIKGGTERKFDGTTEEGDILLIPCFRLLRTAAIEEKKRTK